MTKFKVSSDVEFYDPPIKASKGAIVSIREITSAIQAAVDTGVLVPLGTTPSRPTPQNVSHDPVTVVVHDFQKHVLTTLATISRQLQELTEKIDANTGSKKRK